jgi:thymidylate synthase
MEIKKIGLKDDTGKLRFDLITSESLTGMAEVLTLGANKYEANSWQNVEDGIDKHYASLMRHLIQWRQGEILDEESKLSHIKHVLTNAMFLLHHESKKNNKQLEDICNKNIIKGNNANELFINASKELIANGKYVSPRGLKTLEIEDAWLILKDPNKSIVTLSERKIDLDYLEGEIAWYLSGSLQVEDIAKHSKFWNNIQNKDGTVNSNYGFLAMKEKHNGKTQYQWCVDRIKEDKDTRQAIINYNQPKHKFEDNKDFVCTIAQLFRVNDNKLDSTVLMRSNDMIRGLTYDMPWFTLVQKQLAEETGYDLGVYKHYSASFHVYEKHFDMVNKIAGGKTNDK